MLYELIFHILYHIGSFDFAAIHTSEFKSTLLQHISREDLIHNCDIAILGLQLQIEGDRLQTFDSFNIIHIYC